MGKVLNLWYSVSMTPDELRQQIEQKIVELVQAKVADGTMSEERAQAISKFALETLRPGMTLQELYAAVPKLDDMYQELAPVVLPIEQQYEAGVVKGAQQQVADLIKQGKFDAAAQLGTNVVSHNVSLQWGQAKA